MPPGPPTAAARPARPGARWWARTRWPGRSSASSGTARRCQTCGSRLRCTTVHRRSSSTAATMWRASFWSRSSTTRSPTSMPCVIRTSWRGSRSRGRSAASLLSRLVGADRAERCGLPPPAALIGEWFGSAAVIAPSLNAVAVDDVFAVPTGVSDGPIGGGWFGYLSYPDAGVDGRGPRLPEAAGGWSDCVLRQDRDGQWWYESLTGATLSAWVADAVRTRAPARRYSITWGEADRNAHRHGVLQCLEAIAAGEIYQACVCTQFAGRLDGAPVEFFIDAVERTSPARAAYLAGDWGAVASLSPELFLRRRGEAVTSSPIKGTLPRHADPSALRASVKDVAENIMIVDLVRNDLGRVAITGTVTVPELLAVRPAPGVWHLVSTVSARVGVDVPMAAVLDATFPPASVTGTPKQRARQLLRGWEPDRRGGYCS